MDKQFKRLYEFGPFRLDTQERLLLRDNEVVVLTPKAFDTLVALIQNTGHVIEKGDLMRAVWPDTFVEENTLTSNISTLRKALGQTNGDYIETVPKRGYRFVANVRELHLDTGNLLVERHRRSRVVIREEKDEPEEHEHKRQKFLIRTFFNSRDWKSKRAVLAALPLIVLTAALVYFLIHAKPKPEESRQVRAIAVLPFKTLGEGQADEHLELGLADALITRLGNLRQIIVRPTTAMQKFAGNDQDPVAAGRELGVDTVLAGRVQRAGEQIRVTVQMISVADGSTFWTEKFDGKFTEIFAVQDSISSQVAQAMMLKLTGEERGLLARRYTENAEAYQFFLKGRYFWNKRTREDFKKAIECFKRAIKIDPNFALAYVGLADCYSFVNEATEAKAAAKRALEIDEQMAEAHTSLGNIKLFHDYDWQGAENEFKRSIELRPNYATSHHWYAYYLAAMGRFEEALREIERARELDPLSLAINTDVGHILYLARRYDQAIVAFEKAIDMDQNFINAHMHLADAYARNGMHDEAIREFLKVESLSGERREILAAYEEAYAISGWNGFWQKALALRKERFRSSTYMAEKTLHINLELGEKNQAVEGLKEVFEQRLGLIAFLKVDPKYDSLRSDPRFNDLLQRMRL